MRSFFYCVWNSLRGTKIKSFHFGTALNECGMALTELLQTAIHVDFLPSSVNRAQDSLLKDFQQINFIFFLQIILSRKSLATTKFCSLFKILNLIIILILSIPLKSLLIKHSYHNGYFWSGRVYIPLYKSPLKISFAPSSEGKLNMIFGSTEYNLVTT